MAEERSLAGRRVTEVLASSTGGVGIHLRSVLPAVAAAGAQVRICGPRATEELFGFTASGAAFAPVEISAGLAPAADARAVAALRDALAAQPGARDAYIRGVEDGRAVIEVHLAPPPA